MTDSEDQKLSDKHAMREPFCDHGNRVCMYDEMPVSDLLVTVHQSWCGSEEIHDPACNTLRLLVEDWKHLVDAEHDRRWARVGGSE